ncbi:response regulator [Polyangium sorediatum]|uniref:Response regulator n=1 Tax=Polyangium sorediatum TaxID=889274 RepID=A0ABT6P7H4_9BACT|nr:response regulator [Polyangium sorediatum]MDI1436523.1 response regulator [Polyangium sorediatum]
MDRTEGGRPEAMGVITLEGIAPPSTPERRTEAPKDARPASSPERLGGVRADFVATLGRRVVELRTAVTKLAEEPASPARRDDLRRRVHALAAAARLLRFNKLAEELKTGEALVDRVAERGKLTDDEWKALRSLLDRLPELAWGEASLGAPPEREPAPRSANSGPRTLPSAERPADKPASAVAQGIPQTVLFVGPERLAESLAKDHAEGAASFFEVERTEDLVAAPDLARALAPDVVVIDADKPGARELVASLLADPLTEEVPILLFGRFSRPDDAALYAALGVARTLPKPVSPDALRKACAEVTASYVRREIARAPIGEVTLDDLGTRLAEELRRGLCDAADVRARGTRIELGEGSQVLAALWGAVARIRDLVTIESQGKVRFSPSGPEGALPFAPWLGGPEQSGKATRVRALGEARGARVPTLDRLRVVVADDDAAVTWFLAGVLRAAGATVYEAHDGERAFELACEVAPDLVVSDIVMPGLDGFALCRALKRDFALRDVPVVLLSWKEDLLQRVRELGAGADGYLRKEASASAIVQRLREILRPRLRVAERLAQGGEVRGRLDGLTPRTLLALACAHRPASTLSVRDALYLYEVEIREGRPVRATRTTADGSFERGPGVLARLLGLGAGRFVVAPVDDAAARVSGARPDLEGSLAEQLVAPIASARAAQRLLSGASLMTVERVEIDLDLLGPAEHATPEPLRSLLRSIAAGASPRALVANGKAASHLVEDVLCDAAAHGAITAIVGEAGADLLTPAVHRESERLRGVRRPPPPALIPALADILPEPAPSTPEPISAIIDRSATPGPVLAREEASPAPSILSLQPDEVLSVEVGSVLDLAHMPTEEPTLDVLRQLIAVKQPSPTPGPVAPRKVERLSVPVLTPAPMAVAAPAPLFAPEIMAAPVVMAAPAPAPAPVAAPAPAPRASTLPSARPIPTSLGTLVPPPVEDLPPPPRSALPSAHAPGARTLDSDVESRPSRFRRNEKVSRDSAPPSRREGSSRTRVSVWILFAVAGTVFAVGSRLAHQRVAPAPAPIPTPTVTAEGPPAAAAPPAPEPEPAAAATTPRDRREGDTADFPVMPQDLPLRAEDKVPAGQGLLEVVAGPSDSIYVDGQLVGTGPIVQSKLAPKKDPYEIRVRLRGEERVRFALVKEGRMTRLRIAPPWSR